MTCMDLFESCILYSGTFAGVFDQLLLARNLLSNLTTCQLNISVLYLTVANRSQ